MLMLEENTWLASLGAIVNQLKWGMVGNDFASRSVNIQDHMKMFIPIKLFLVDQFGEDSNDFVCNFSLAVYLWIIGCWHPIFELKMHCEMFNGIIYEMCALVTNQRKWTTKVSKDELKKEKNYYCHHIGL